MQFREGGDGVQCDALLARFVQMSRATLGDQLVGVYLHGSAAMGCFDARQSDLDLLLVVRDALSPASKRAFLEGVVPLHLAGPKKGLELSILRQAACRPFLHPAPYELHFSAAHLQALLDDPEGYIRRMQGVDPDLAAHVTVLHAYGKALWGPPVGEVFGPVARADYVDSIWRDVQNAPAEIVQAPVYLILNLCRVLAFLQEGAVLSKRAGGEWGLRVLPSAFHPLIAAALRSYATGTQMQADAAHARRFAQDMLDRIAAQKNDQLF